MKHSFALVKRPIASLMLALCLSLASNMAAADLDKGGLAIIQQNYATAFKEFKESAQQGHAIAQYNLGLMYVNGQGVVKNERTAAMWYQKAADQGNAIAQSDLGFMYANGQGVVKNESTAAEWYQKAADQGIAQAQFNLGVMYKNGRGVVLNYQTAYFWWLLASANGDENAKKAMDIVEKILSPAQKQEAQDDAARWQPKPAR